jgi:hypothetical protein
LRRTTARVIACIKPHAEKRFCVIPVTSAVAPSVSFAIGKIYGSAMTKFNQTAQISRSRIYVRFGRNRDRHTAGM